MSVSGLIARKVGMSRIFLESGEAVAVTYLQVDPNVVVRTKTEDKDGYNAVVLGVHKNERKTKNGKDISKYGAQKEWKVDSLEGVESGKEITAENIPKDSKVTISGTSKGKGFQGVIKRWGFSRGPETHGSHHHRRPGSVGMCEFPGRVLKGKKMPGHTGHQTVTLQGRSVVVSDPAKGIIGVKGPIPGPNGGFVYVSVESTPDE